MRTAPPVCIPFLSGLLLLHVGLLILSVLPLAAQVVDVRTVDTVARTAAPSAVVSLLRAATGEVVVRILTDAQGRGRLVATGPGTYRLRVDRIGYAATLTPDFTLAGAGDTAVQRIGLNPERVILPEVQVVAGDVACHAAGVGGPELAATWEEARKTLTATALLAESQRPLMERWQWERSVTPLARLRGAGTDRVRYTREAPFVSLSPVSARETGFAREEREGTTFYVPNASLLLDEAFLDTHCFRLDAEERRGEGLLGLRFEPLPERRVPEIAGALWLRRSDGVLTEITFQYTNLPAGVLTYRPGGKVSLAPVEGVGWIVDEWYVQTPLLGGVDDGSFGARRAARRAGALAGYHVTGGKARVLGVGVGSSVAEVGLDTPALCGPTPVSGDGLGVVVARVRPGPPGEPGIAETPVVVTVGGRDRQTIRVGDGQGVGIERAAVTVEGKTDAAGLLTVCGVPMGARVTVQGGGTGRDKGPVVEARVDALWTEVVVARAGAERPRAVSHVLRGKVVDTAGTGLPGVEVVLAEAGRKTATDSGGRYSVGGIPKGGYQVVYRRLGYAPAVVFRSFRGDTSTTEVDVQLAMEAVVLPELETTAADPEAVPVKLREWARRREFNGGGKFWDDSLLRSLEYRGLADVLQPVSGVRILGAAGSGIAILTTYGGRAGVTRGDPCEVVVYLDGLRIGIPKIAPFNLNDVPVHQIAAMEFYRSASEIPVELNSTWSMCGVLAIWTRVGGGR